jgi:hypothetical protein
MNKKMNDYIDELTRTHYSTMRIITSEDEYYEELINIENELYKIEEDKFYKELEG